MVKVNITTGSSKSSKEPELTKDPNDIKDYRQHLSTLDSKSEGWSLWKSKEKEDISQFKCTACLQNASFKYCFDKTKSTGKCCRLGDVTEGCNNHKQQCSSIFSKTKSQKFEICPHVAT
jgi:hypothetical protein